MMSSITANLLECAICSERFNDPQTTECGHSFCKPCITAWIKQNPSCPTCRHSIQKASPNIVLKQIIEATAEKAEGCAKPVMASIPPPKLPEPVSESASSPMEANAQKLESRARPVIVSIPTPKLPTPLSEPAAAPLVMLKSSALPVLASIPSSKLPAPVSESATPLVVHISLYDRIKRQVFAYQMPQARGNVKSILETQRAGTKPSEQLTGKVAAAKFEVLLFMQPISVGDALNLQDFSARLIPVKTFKSIHALSFQKDTVTIATDKCELTYRLPQQYLQVYRKAQDPSALDAAIQSIVKYILSQPNQMQMRLLVPKECSGEKIPAYFQKCLQTTLCNPNARLADFFELECETDPALKEYVGQTFDKPVVVPITGACTIDQLPQVIEMLKRKKC